MSRLLLWKPKHGKKAVGRPTITSNDILRQDTGMETTKIRTAMLDRSPAQECVEGHHSPSQFELKTRLKQAWEASKQFYRKIS